MEIEEKPSWKTGVERPKFPKLGQDLTCDVAIIGGGLAGVLSAYMLSKSGKKVAVFEKDHIGSGATEYTTAFITQEIDTDLPELVRLLGDSKARLVWQSGSDAIAQIERIANEENIDCEFKRTSIFTYANDAEQYEKLEKNAKQASDFGSDVTEVSKEDLGFVNSGHYMLRNQAKFHPLKFLFGLAGKLAESKVKIYEQSEVEKIDHAEFGVNLKVGNHIVSAGQVVVATYQPFHNRIRLFLKRGMYKSFVLESQIPKGTIAEGLYQDMDNPYHYFRIDPGEDYDRMILGGEDVKSIFKVSPEKSYKALKNISRKYYPTWNFVLPAAGLDPYSNHRTACRL